MPVLGQSEIEQLLVKEYQVAMKEAHGRTLKKIILSEEFYTALIADFTKNYPKAMERFGYEAAQVQIGETWVTKGPKTGRMDVQMLVWSTPIDVDVKDVEFD